MALWWRVLWPPALLGTALESAPLALSRHTSRSVAASGTVALAGARPGWTAQGGKIPTICDYLLARPFSTRFLVGEKKKYGTRILCAQWLPVAWAWRSWLWHRHCSVRMLLRLLFFHANLFNRLDFSCKVIHIFL